MNSVKLISQKEMKILSLSCIISIICWIHFLQFMCRGIFYTQNASSSHMGSEWTSYTVLNNFRETIADSDEDDEDDEAEKDVYPTQTVSQDSGLESDMEIENSVNHSTGKAQEQLQLASDLKSSVSATDGSKSERKGQSNKEKKSDITEEEVVSILKTDFSWWSEMTS